MPLDPVQLLSDLIAIPSVNPMGREVDAAICFEHRVTEYLERLFKSLGLPWERQTVEPGRDNIIARVDGAVSPDKGGRVVLLEAHQDTVPVDGMIIDPFKPDVRDGRIYGRGSCDIKGGMAAMLCAVAKLAETRPAAMPTIIMACTMNEEHGFTGATALTKLWADGAARSIIPRRPDAAIVAEPTELNVVVAHKGAARWKAHTTGRAAHSSNPALGDSAIYKMAGVLLALQEYAERVTPTLGSHPRCGKPTLSVGTIRGGLSVNTVPDRCTVEIDRRVIPGETSADAYQQVIDYVAKHPAVKCKVEHEPLYLQGIALPDTHNGPLGEKLADVARRLTGKGEIMGVPFGTDASKFAQTGVPSVVFGPGNVAQAHTIDEWLELAQLPKAVDVLVEYLSAGA